MMLPSWATLAAGTALPALTSALLVAPGSPCASNCGNVLDATTSDDVVCGPDDYTNGYNNNAAVVFQSCLQCEIQSGYATKDNFTDAMAMLYTLRYTVSYCVLDFPQNSHFSTTPCSSSKTCGPFMNGLKYMNLSSQYDDSFEFCDRWPTYSGSLTNLMICTQCLQASNEYYLANFMTVLHAGCTQKPEPGVALGIQGNMFSNNAVKIVPPTPTATINPDWFEHGPLTLGGRVGIAIGCIIIALMLAGMAVIWRGKKRRRQFLRKIGTQFANTKNEGGGDAGAGWPTPQRDMGETPLSQRPLRGWDDSPMTLSTEKTFPRYFSPYSSQYNSPVSAQDGQQMAWPEPALGSPREIGIALADRHQWLQSPIEQDKEKGKLRDDSYEMQHVDGVGGFPSIKQATD